MKKIVIILVMISFFSGYQAHCQSNWIKKAKAKLEKKGDKAVDKILSGKKKEDSSNSSTNGNANGSSSRPSGTAGERSNTPPPVDGSITEAKNALGMTNYSDTRYYIQQALWGIEYDLGKQILESMPSSISSIPSDETEDLITSSGMGFVGLNIQRVYKKDEQYLKAQLVNGSAFAGTYQMVLSNPGMYNSSESDFKTITVNGYKAVIEYTSRGYTLGVPFGQSSAFVLETIGFKTEDEAVAALKQFDIDQFKKVLGEQ